MIGVKFPGLSFSWENQQSAYAKTKTQNDQLRSNCQADQRLSFRYSDSTIPLLLKSKISSL